MPKVIVLEILRVHVSKNQTFSNFRGHSSKIDFAQILPREILISCESLSLRELTVQVLLDLELYRIVKNDAISELPSVR